MMLRKLCVHVATLVWVGTLLFSWGLFAYLTDHPIEHRELYFSLSIFCSIVHFIYWDKVIRKANAWADIQLSEDSKGTDVIGSTFSSKDLVELLVLNKHLLPEHVRNAMDSNANVHLSVNAQYSEIK